MTTVTPFQRANPASDLIVSGAKPHYIALAATASFLAWAVYYGLLLYPGLGGEINAGDSAKLQILGHSSIMLHGPGYPLVLMLAAGLRALSLPLPEWWSIAFLISGVPAALANATALLLVHRLSGNLVLAFAASLLAGSAHLMAIQATEAEVYALNLAFLLTTIYLLLLFMQTRRPSMFLAACAVYAFSFGNHLMMIMLLPLFVWVTVLHRGVILRPARVTIVLVFILLGASQYLYLAHVAHDPNTSYSEYMPLPPTGMELIRYIAGTRFSEWYGTGLESPATLKALMGTLWSAHPWISVPIIAAGLIAFLLGWPRRDTSWRGIALLYGGALCFLPFVIWYGAWDISAFHLPVLAPLLLAGMASLGWAVRQRWVLLHGMVALLLVIGLVRSAETAVQLRGREPAFAGLIPPIEEMVAHLPTDRATDRPADRPIVAMGYDLRMAALYYELLGELPPVTYRLEWRVAYEFDYRSSISGIVVPTSGPAFERLIEQRRSGVTCSTRKLALSEQVKWPVHAYECRIRDEGSAGGRG